MQEGVRTYFVHPLSVERSVTEIYTGSNSRVVHLTDGDKEEGDVLRDLVDGCPLRLWSL